MGLQNEGDENTLWKHLNRGRENIEMATQAKLCRVRRAPIKRWNQGRGTHDTVLDHGRQISVQRYWLRAGFDTVQNTLAYSHTFSRENFSQSSYVGTNSTLWKTRNTLTLIKRNFDVTVYWKYDEDLRNNSIQCNLNLWPLKRDEMTVLSWRKMIVGEIKYERVALRLIYEACKRQMMHRSKINLE